jgi:fatty-acyl-CoA synthase
MTLLEAEPAETRVGGKSSAKTGALQDWVRALEATAPIAREPQRTLPRVIEDVAAKCGERAALIGTHETLSYRALTGHANRYARWALAQNLAKGETVCLIMPNRPEYMAIWLGISAVGGVAALINTNLRGMALAHCIDIVAPRHVIVDTAFADAFRSAAPHLSSRTRVWSHGDGDFPRVDLEIERLSAAPLSDAERRDVSIADRALQIYTSGTTGLPKAANVSHRRLMQWSLWFAGLMNTGPDDRMYDCLPMYHSVGGVVATGALLVRGGSVVIREKFSAQQFWNDVVEWDCTLFQYIGELCRYLLNAALDPRERAHRLRLCCGNGLRADVWEKFQARFQIPRVLEFYASTEGNFSLYNAEGKVGAIGRVPPFMRHRFPLALVRSDPTTNEPVRDQAGFCIRRAAGEVGEAIGKIGDDAAHAAAAFEGYTSTKDSERKILRDVFKRGDAWYRTGDLMRMDGSGFFYFVDRIGDTFRWKGENVATLEVAEALMAFPGIAEATVYGVAVPAAEGAAGMAAITPSGPLDFSRLREHLAARLPPYARPLFLRVMPRLAITATFKHQKNDLVRQGFNPSATDDAIYFDEPAQKAYVRLDDTLYGRIAAGVVRL